MSLAARADYRRRAVVVELSAYDAHDLGRYLYSEGMSRNDHVWEDGIQLLEASHRLAGRCVEPRDCPGTTPVVGP